jgi:predicted metal-binding protein
MVRKIVENIPEDLIKEDLEKYRKRALELGATDAKIITSDDIVIDERVRAKCIYPKCPWYGTNAQCPPHAMDIDMTRKLVQRYKHGLFLDIVVPPEIVTDGAKRRAHVSSGLKMHEIVSKIEAEAFYDGYHLALGFGVGPCKSYFCPEVECSALTPGQGCRHPLKARASMEGIGMDAYSMAAKAGWDIYPVGSQTSPDKLPHGHRLGLVLIY